MAQLIADAVFYEIAALLALAAVVGFIGHLLRQPLIVTFIAVGILAGPSVLDLARSSEHIDLLSELGIAVLLFLVGIRLDLKLIRSLGPVSLTTGLGQVAFTSLIGFFIGLALGLDAVTSAYVAVALTFSSTIIIVKLLSDKREIDSLHGRIALGFLIVQDLVVVLAMMALSAVGLGAREEATLGGILGVVAAGMALLLLVLVFVRFAADSLTALLSRTPELLIVCALALAVLLAATGDYLGYGKELGGLLAGVALASTPYREAIAARLAPLRDFLLLFFFIALGMRLAFDNLGANLFASAIFSLFVLVGNPFIVIAIMGAMGYRRRTGFLAGLTVAQISEFSLIFMAMGVTLGHVTEESLALVTLVGLITIAASTYMITYSHQLYVWFEPCLGRFERHGTPREQLEDHRADTSCELMIFGLGRFGTAIGRRLAASGKQVLGVDFDPDAVRMWRKRGLDAVYGDATDPEFLATLPLAGADWAVSTIPKRESGVTHDDAQIALMHGLRAGGFRGRCSVTSRNEEESQELSRAGADLVLEPFQDAADRAVELLIAQVPGERR